MIEKVRQTLQQAGPLDAERAIVVGFSGGPDSTCLVDVLQELGYPLILAHLDHGLRPDSRADVAHVRRVAERRGWPLEVARESVADLAAEPGVSLEEAGRQARYRFLFKQADRYGAQAVAVGHTADDQVETVLMHLLRGAGLSGLKGMTPRSLLPLWSPTIPLTRPLLACWRVEVLAYCQERNLDFLTDPTNQDTRMYRNRLRHELIPFLEGYNPRVREAIWRSARVLAGDLQVVSQALDGYWEQALLHHGPGYAGLSYATLRAAPVGVQRSLLRRAIALVRPGLRDVDFDDLELGIAFLAQPPASHKSDLAGGLHLLLEGDTLLLATWGADLPRSQWPQLPTGAARPLPVPGKVLLPSGWRLTASQEPDPEQAYQMAQARPLPYRTWVDAGTIQGALSVRGRRPGDRFQPLGMEGRAMKVSDFMINVKLPRRARHAWPLVCCGAGIVWIPGYRLGHPFRLTARTRTAIRLELINEGMEAEP